MSHQDAGGVAANWAAWLGGDTPGLVAGEQLGRRPPSGLVLAIDVGECLAVGVADDEAQRAAGGRRELWARLQLPANFPVSAAIAHAFLA
jgi:hypothetical protein